MELSHNPKQIDQGEKVVILSHNLMGEKNRIRQN
jgi:hypothetical protein